MAPRSFSSRLGRSKKTTLVFSSLTPGCKKLTEHSSYKDAIAIEVGQNDTVERFSVHKDLLCQGSTFFESALNGQWRESTDKKVLLPEDHPRVFEIYVHWLYYRRMALKIVEGYTPEDRANQAKRKALLEDQAFLLEAYVFADKIMDVDFADAIFDILVATITIQITYPVNSLVQALVRVSGCTLEQLLVDLLVFNKNPEDCYNNLSQSVGMMGRQTTDKWALMDRIMRKAFAGLGMKAAGSKPLWCSDLCNYHKHGTNRTCYKVKYTA